MSELRTMTRRVQAMVGTRRDGIWGPVTAQATLAWMHNAQAASGAEMVEEPPKRAEAAEFDARTEMNLKTLDPKAQAKFRQLVARAQAIAASMGCEYRAISGHRTYAEQAKLRAAWQAGRGGKAAAPGYSNHNFAIAVDFGVFQGGDYLDGSQVKIRRDLAAAVHRAVAEVARPMGMEWGGDWRGRDCDPPHFQLTTNLSMAEKRRRMKEKGTVL